MSYLGPLRLHFAGKFQADPSTVNNDVRHYDNGAFREDFQKPQAGDEMNGWWDPNGSGAFRLVGCKVTMVSYADGTTSQRDPVVGLSIADANTRVAGKMVDLDPQQQLASQLWGLIVRLTDGTADRFAGPFEVAPFADLWMARATGGKGGDFGMGSMYQSVIGPVTWGDPGVVRASGAPPSRFLHELRAASPEGLLSIKFNVDGYDMDDTSPDFTLGRLTGTIGPARPDEPRHFIAGRQLLPQIANNQPAGPMNFMPAVVDERMKRIYADFGNALPTKRPGGPLADIGKLQLGYVDRKNRFHSLGTVAYQQRGWYTTTAGIQAFPNNRALTKDELAALRKFRLTVVQDGKMALQENFDGLHARADQFVFRLEPGETANVQIHATQYGRPLAKAKLAVFADTGGLQPAGNPKDGLGEPPKFGVPEDAIRFHKTITTDRHGRATLAIKASDPRNPRHYIDGQVYGVRYLLAQVYKQIDDEWSFGWNPADFVSLLVFDAYKAPKRPTWHHLQPIFEQYANLYPLMGRIVDLASYESVVAHARILSFAFGLPPADPNYMPATRDLSAGKREAILRFLAKPVRGKPLRPPLALPATLDSDEPSIATVRNAAAENLGAHPKQGAKAFALGTRGPVHHPEKD